MEDKQNITTNWMNTEKKALKTHQRHFETSRRWAMKQWNGGKIKKEKTLEEINNNKQSVPFDTYGSQIELDCVFSERNECVKWKNNIKAMYYDIHISVWDRNGEVSFFSVFSLCYVWISLCATIFFSFFTITLYSIHRLRNRRVNLLFWKIEDSLSSNRLCVS